jgi:hypothetical protein
MLNCRHERRRVEGIGPETRQSLRNFLDLRIGQDLSFRSWDSSLQSKGALSLGYRPAGRVSKGPPPGGRRRRSNRLS